MEFNNFSGKNVKSKKILKPLLIAAISSVLTLAVVVQVLSIDLRHLPSQMYIMRKVNQVDSRVRNNAIFPPHGNVGGMLAEAYIHAMEDDLYADYLDRAANRERVAHWRGEAAGMIGILVSKRYSEDYVRVIYVHRQGPGKQAGMERGDKIIAVDGESARGKYSEDLVDKIREKGKAEITFTVMRGEEELEFNITPADFLSDSVSWEMIDDLGYIHIMEFNDTTPEQLSEAVEYITRNNAAGLVFDLRNNGGGTLSAFAQVMDMVVGEGPTVRMRYVDGVDRVIHTSDSEEIDLPMVLLVNGDSASASEVFAMNFRDFEKGLIIGETTYGKLTSQTTFNLFDGSAIRISTSKVVDSNGDSFEGIGIQPDIEVPLSEEQHRDFNFLSREEDIQLITAIKALRGTTE